MIVSVKKSEEHTCTHICVCKYYLRRLSPIPLKRLFYVNIHNLDWYIEVWFYCTVSGSKGEAIRQKGIRWFLYCKCHLLYLILFCITLVIFPLMKIDIMKFVLGP